MRIGLIGAQGFLALLVRRKWWVIAPFVALSCAVTILTSVLPEIFVSETLILIRARDVPEDFVMDLIAGTTEQRLKSIQQTVLSRTNLTQIIREFQDDLPEYRRISNMDAKVAKLRNEIKIFFEVERTVGRRQTSLNYFRISYQNQNPELAQKIASKLTALFIEQDNRARESQVFGTTEFLAAELEKVSEQLNVSEAELKQVKSSRQFELPDQLETNLRTLDRLMVQKQTNAEALDRYATMRLNLENQLAQTPEVVPLATLPAPRLPDTPKNLLVEDYRKAESAYNQAAAKYTAKHPEVQAAKVQMERLREQIPADALAAIPSDAGPSGNATDPAPVATAPNPVYAQLATQLRDVETEYGLRQSEKRWIEGEIARYSRRVENTPNTELEIAEVLRQNQDLKKQYEDLKDKVAQARLSESLESQQKGSQFQVADPANYPLTPTKPDKPLVLFAGILGSLAISIGFAAAVDVARQRVWTQSEIESFWGVPVLIDIPEILTDSDVAVIRKKRFTWAASSVAAAGAFSFCLYLVYLKHNFILQQLDPIIQRLVYR